MRVILMQSIDKVGTKGDVINVKRGFARNYLVPRNYAIYATPQNLKQLEALKKQFADEESQKIEQMKELGTKITSLKLIFVRKVDEHDSMYGSVSEMDLIHELKEKGIDIPKSAILLDKHIKNLGEHDIQIRLHKEVNVLLHIDVEKEESEKDKSSTSAKIEVKPSLDDETESDMEESGEELPADDESIDEAELAEEIEDKE